MDEGQIHLSISGTALDFNSYSENLIKEGERKRRLAGQPLELVIIQEDTRYLFNVIGSGHLPATKKKFRICVDHHSLV